MFSYSMNDSMMMQLNSYVLVRISLGQECPSERKECPERNYVRKKALYEINFQCFH